MNDQIPMFRLKALKTDRVPEQWVIFTFDGKTTHLHYLRYKQDEFHHRGYQFGNNLTVVDIAAMVRTKQQCVVIGCGVYPWLCAQGLYEQFTAGQISLPMGNGSSNAGVLSGQFHCGDPTLIDIVCNGRNLHFVDMRNLGLDELCAAADPRHILRQYVAMVRTYGLGSFRDTAAGQGSCRFRTHDLGEQRVYCHQVPEVRRLERDAFYGGRCEALTIGKVASPCVNYDYKSVHPTIALTESFPTRLIEYGTGMVPAWWDIGFHGETHCIAKCTVRTDSPDYPLRHDFGTERQDWRTVYPTGEFVTSLCWPELRHALMRDRVKEMHFWAVYDAAPIFTANSEWYFQVRKSLQASDLRSMVGPLKLCQNSLYGHMGRRGRAWMNTTIWHDAQWGMWWARHPTVGNVVHHRAIYGQHQYLDSGVEPQTSIPAISAAMFSYSRIKLLDLISLAGRDNVHYCDTDNVIADKARKSSRLRDNDGISIKGMGEDLDIRGLKYYHFAGQWVHAGVPAWAIRHFDGSASFEKHLPFNYGLWNGTPFANKYLLAKNDPHPEYRHGNVLPCGRTEPFVFCVQNGFNKLEQL